MSLACQDNYQNPRELLNLVLHLLFVPSFSSQRSLHLLTYLDRSKDGPSWPWPLLLILTSCRLWSWTEFCFQLLHAYPTPSPLKILAPYSTLFLLVIRLIVTQMVLYDLLFNSLKMLLSVLTWGCKPVRWLMLQSDCLVWFSHVGPQPFCESLAYGNII